MAIEKATAWRGTRRLNSISINEIIQRLFINSKPPAHKIAILTQKPYILNGFYTTLLEINRQSFRIEEHGLRHVSGILFKLDCLNYQEAAKFLHGSIA